ncbi:hypothetical protein KP509_05G018200 [Ceratopteris richardii]|uniref:Cilia- and flagella-associated protein 251 n=1 Tax=Ceratopteris richardii TaxID=49495 RepID=A0A8T2URK5_CERRI|nr:hypothetical protein KP509_05G018200 [Ceratopteris richardii]KAH7436407.1 hypothetical protein KP509_05G018200 [Ceratopteris richardii]
MDSPLLPLDLQWVFGASHIRAGVIDLRTAENKNTIAYAAGHNLVLYDRSLHWQRFLQGHVHHIQCLAACPKRKYIVSADCGSEAILIVWSSENGQVHSSIPQKETGGIIAIDFFEKGDKFATLSTIDRNRMQTMCIWRIEATTCQIASSLSVFSTDFQHSLQINKDDQDELITNGKKTVYFWKLFKEEGENTPLKKVLRREKASIKTVEMLKNIREFTVSCFLPNSDSAITGMVSGEVIFWQEPRSPFFKEESKSLSVSDSDESNKLPSARKMYAIKIVQLHDTPITHISVQNSYVITGGSDGYLRFYDCRLGLIGWLEELQAGEITSVSFSTLSSCEQEANFTIQVPPFIVGTRKGHMILLHAGIFEEPSGSLQHKGEELLDYIPTMVKCVTAHPHLPYFAMISADGLLQVHDYNTRNVCSQREFSKLKAEFITYSPTGSVLACGFSTGFLKIIDSDSLQDVDNIAISRSGITKLEFSSDESLLAIADSSFAVSLVNCFISKDHVDEKWEYVGKFRSHAREIAGLHFAKVNGNNRLFSVGHDCMIVEYDLTESVKEKRLKLKGTWPVNSSGIPIALYSTTFFEQGELHLLISDSNFKIRIYDTKNFICHRTLLGPTFGTPVDSTFRLSLEHCTQEILAFGTKDQILGIMILPLRNNKIIQYMGVIGHAGFIQHMTISHDKKYLLTVSAHDGIINLWRVSLPLAKAFFESEENPISGHFKGSIGAKNLQLIREYFFTSQIFSQGEGFTNERILDSTVEIDQLHNLLSAVGVFPSLHELQEILTEINETFPMQKSISFKDFLPIFLNHKPVIELNPETIHHAFSAIGLDPHGTNTDILMTTLQNEGERMTREEIQQCFEKILHKHVNLDALPRNISATWFCNKVLKYLGHRA